MANRIPVFLVVAVLAACGTDHAGSRTAGSTAGQAATEAPPAPEAALDAELRVVFLGTSLSAGFGLLHPEDRFTAVLERMADSAGLPVRAVNAGVSGSTSAGGVSRLEWVLAEPLDVLVLELGANDGLRGHDPAALGENLRTVVRETRARHPDARILLTGMEAPPNLGEDYTDRFRRVFADVAADMDVALVPFLLEGVAGEPELNQEDGIHPNAAGHRRIARTVWPVLEPLLREATQRRRRGS